jgi:Mg/Co/Ni transporter MgtE
MNTTQSLAFRYATAHPRAAAQRLQELDSGQAASFLAELEPAASAAVVEQMWPGAAALVLDLIPLDQVEKVLEGLKLTKTVALLQQLPAEARDRIVDALNPPLQTRVRKALSLPIGTAGSAADSTITPFEVDTTVGEALARGLDQRLPYLYVVDRDYHLVGVLHRREMEAAKENAQLRSIMTTQPSKIPATTPLAVLHQHGAWSTLDALPVVDARDTFLGVIRHKSLRASLRSPKTLYRPTTALETLLDLGEVYWAGLFSAIEVLAESGTHMEDEDTQ